MYRKRPAWNVKNDWQYKTRDKKRIHILLNFKQGCKIVGDCLICVTRV